jgi:hypothetical protein
VLVDEMNRLIGKIEEIKNREADLLSKTAEKNLEQVYDEVKKSIPLESAVQRELTRYGISQEKIETLSPENLFDEVKSWYQFLRNFSKISTIQIILIVLGVLLLLFAVINPAGLLNRYISIGQTTILSFFGIAGPLFVNLYKTFEKYRKLYLPVKEYKDRFNRELATIRSKYEEECRTTKAALNVTGAELDAKNKQLDGLTREIETIEHQITYSITGKAFFEFIKNKRQDEQYGKNLSIITTIRRDFETLSELFQSYNIPQDINRQEREKAEKRKKEVDDFQNLFNKPLDRIILYVDDLDRCTEDRVIEVLEAVNLLMAFPLFVVVVGVDPRWVKGALIKKYTLQFTGILNNQTLVTEYGLTPINVTDYLEKIFQIPFYLQEADVDGVNSLIDDMLTGQVNSDKKEKEDNNVETKNVTVGEVVESKQNLVENGAPKVLQIDNSNAVATGKTEAARAKAIRFQPKNLLLSSQELEDLKSFAWLVGTNPRALKRFVNIYRIIRSHEGLSYSETTERANFLCIIMLIGLYTGEYRSISKEFCQYCKMNPGALIEVLLETLKSKESTEFKNRLESKNIPEILKTLKLSEFNRYINFVRRFSFDSPAHA